MTFRLLPYAPATAADNMAIDEAILEAHLKGLVPPTLRLYSFEPATVSLGYAQDLSPETIEKIRKRGFDLVRRPTGGRAVLHADELTYSFVCMSVTGAGTAGDGGSPGALPHEHGSADAGLSASTEAPTGARLALEKVARGTAATATANTAAAGDQIFLSGSVAVAYKQICQGLLAAMQLLGLELELGTSTSNSAYKAMDDCFMAVTGADLHYQGKKMIGSAQLRRRGAVLQHGSILLDQDQNLMGSITGGGAGLKKREPALEIGVAADGSHCASSAASASGVAASHHANLFEALGRRLSFDELQAALKAGFEEAFARELTVSSLTDEEIAAAAELKKKYLKLERQ